MTEEKAPPNDADQQFNVKPGDFLVVRPKETGHVTPAVVISIEVKPSLVDGEPVQVALVMCTRDGKLRDVELIREDEGWRWRKASY